MSEPPEKIFDPFHHDGEPPNMLQPAAAQMLQLNAPTMVDANNVVEVDPAQAVVVDTSAPDMVDDQDVRTLSTAPQAAELRHRDEDAEPHA